jgi:heptosyltransferase-2
MSAAPGLVVRLPNWVGDVCMALPAIAELARRQELVLLGKPWAVDLLAGMPWRVEVLERGHRPLVRQLRALRATGAQRALLFTNSFGSALQCRLAGLAARGYRGDWRSWLLAEAVRRPAVVHEVEVFWRLVQEAPEPAPQHLGLQLHPRHREQAAAALLAAGISPPYTVLCPLAAGTAHGRSKLWPAFPLLARGLSEQGVALVACPGPGEEAAAAAVLPGVRLLPGLRLGAYAAVLAGADRVVANDSGPMHLAAAVDASILGVFGVSDPARTGPWSVFGRTVGSSTAWPTVQEVAEAWTLARRKQGPWPDPEGDGHATDGHPGQ